MVWVDGLESIFWGEFWLIFEGIEMGDSMNIDQSLDDIIQSSRTVIRTEGGSGGGGSGYGGDGRKPMYSSRVNRTIYKPSGRRVGGFNTFTSELFCLLNEFVLFCWRVGERNFAVANCLSQTILLLVGIERCGSIAGRSRYL